MNARRAPRGRAGGMLVLALLVALWAWVAAPATSGAFTARIANSNNAAVTANPFRCEDTFLSSDLAAAEYFEYRLVGNATTVTDYGGAGNYGTFQGTHGTETASPMACPNDSTSTYPYAYRPDGSTAYLTSQNAVTASTTTFSVEIWFKTTVAGGFLVGYGNTQTGASSQYDRQLYLNTSGDVVFGTYNSTFQTVVSPAAYNDGLWHFAVGTLSPSAGMTLYVDGKSVASNSAYTTAESFTGYWRVAYQATGGWPGVASNGYFSGSLRFVAAFSVAIAANEIYREYRNGIPA